MPKAATTPPDPDLNAKYLDHLRHHPAAEPMTLTNRRYPALALRTKAGISAGVWTMTFYPPGSRTKARHPLGEWPQMTLTEAADAAADAKAGLKKGVDPRAAKARQIAAEKAEKDAAEAERLRIANRMTFRRLTDEFLRSYVEPRKTKASAANDRLNLGHACAEFGDREISTIRRREIATFLSGIAMRHPTKGNRIHSVMSTAFNFAVQREDIEASPMARLPKAGVEVAKDRVIADRELAVLQRAIMAAPRIAPGVIGAFKLLVISGLRPAEVCGLLWEDCADLDDPNEARITIPGSRMKAGRAHVLPLAPLARSIVLEQRQRVDSTTAIFGSRFGIRDTIARHSLSQLFKRVIADLDPADHPGDEAAVASLRASPPTPHDARRFCATVLSRLGIDRETRLMIFAHAQPGVHGTYDRHDRIAERRAALARLEQYVGNVLDPKPTSNVVVLHRA